MRKLATFALSYSAAVFSAAYLIPRDWWLISAGIALLSSFVGIYRLRSERRLRVLLIAFGAAFGLIRCAFFAASVTEPAAALSGQTLTASARVTNYPQISGENTAIEVLLTERGYPRIKATVWAYRTELPELVPGDEIRLTIKFRTSSVTEGWDSGSARGILQSGSLRDELELTGHWRFSAVYFPLALAREIKAMLWRIYPEDVAPLITALITGDRGLLNDDYELNGAMGRAGVLHMVAVSGMHVAFVVSMVTLLMGARRSAVISLPVVAVFVVMTGANPPVLRAGFMQAALLLAPRFRRENDSITSLSAALALILTQNPASAINAGLQLSFAAIAGTIAAGPRVNGYFHKFSAKLGLDEKPFLGAAFRFISSSLASTVGASIFSIPLVALHFGYVSLVSAAANLLILWAMTVSFCGGLAAYALGFISTGLGTFAAWLLAWLLRYCAATVKLLSALPFAAIYTANNFVGWWLCASYALIAVSVIQKRRRVETIRPWFATLLSVCLLCALMLATSLLNDFIVGRVTVLDVGQGMGIAVFSGRGTVVIDCGGNAYPGAGAIMSEYLHSVNRSTVDLLVLTHLHDDHANGVAELFALTDIRRIAMPPDDGDDDYLRPVILELAERNGTEIIYVHEDMELQVVGMQLNLFAPVGANSTNERGVVILGRIREFDFLVMGDVDSKTEHTLMRVHELPDIELLVAGHHGSRYSTSAELLLTVTPEYAVISSGRNNYGHPTGEVLRRLYDADCEIYRTDLSGNVTVQINSRPAAAD